MSPVSTASVKASATVRDRKGLWISLLFFYFVHPFLVNGFVAFSYAVTYGIPILYLLANPSYLRKLLGVLQRREGVVFLVGFLLLMVWSVLTIALNNSNDWSFFWTIAGPFRTLIRYMFLVVVLLKMYPNSSIPYEERFMHYFILANVYYIGFTLLLAIFPSFKSFWLSFIYNERIDLFESYGYQNRVSIDGFAGFRSTIACSMGIIFCFYLSSKRRSTFYTLLAAVMLIGNFFYGRSGLVTSIVITALAAMWYRKINLRLMLTILIIVAFLVLLIRLLFAVNQDFSSTYEWATRPVVELLTTGTTESGSFETMTHRMLWMPPAKTLAIGDGRFTDPVTHSYYMRTDLGFMRLSLFGGLPACLIVYLSVLIGIWNISRHRRFLFVTISLLFAVFEFKGITWISVLPFIIIIAMTMNLNRSTNSHT